MSGAEIAVVSLILVSFVIYVLYLCGVRMPQFYYGLASGVGLTLVISAIHVLGEK